jgi:hypothetical protein
MQSCIVLHTASEDKATVFVHCLTVVTGEAQPLQVVAFVRATLCSGQDVVDNLGGMTAAPAARFFMQYLGA